MVLSNSIKKRFVKDTGLPINVVQEPVFTYALELLDSDFNSKQKFENFKKMIEKLGSEENFFQLSSKVTNNVIDYVKNQDGFKKLEKEKLSVSNNNVKKETLYQEKNNGKTFVSIDLIKANFNAIKHYEESILPDTYEELVRMFTEYDFFVESKYIRQVIFGNLLPKKIQVIQKQIIADLAETLSYYNISTSSSDELIIETDDIDRVKELVNSKYDFLRIEKFKLNNFFKDYYVKEFESGNIEFKQCPIVFFLQIYKIFHNMEIVELDRKFYFEKMLATFDKSLLE